MAGICFHCGKRLLDDVGRAITPVEINYHGNTVRTHKGCARQLQRKTPTARAITNATGDVYVDDRDGQTPLRGLRRRAWETE